jgi:Cys-tRNA(Pro)/Cys-tRNA(Cys) deacylase
MDIKTNVMRILDKEKSNYQTHSYKTDEAISGVEVAKAINQDSKKVFKTLVTVGKSKKYYVFMIPVDNELDLKKAANFVNEKSIEMIKSKDLLPLTGDLVTATLKPSFSKSSFTFGNAVVLPTFSDPSIAINFPAITSLSLIPVLFHTSYILQVHS